jgi:hypothetical protein
MIIGPNRKRYCVDDNGVSSQTTGGKADLRVNFSGTTKDEQKFQTAVDVDPKDLLGRVKVEVCEREGIDARTKCVIRDRREWDTLQVLGRWQLRAGIRRLDPGLSFEENRISDGSLLMLADNPAIASICPICLGTGQPVEGPLVDPPFDTLHSVDVRYHCEKCNWHWETHFFPDGSVTTEEENLWLHIYSRALMHVCNFPVTSRTKVGAVLKQYLQACEQSRKTEPPDLERFKLKFEERILDNMKTFADEGIYYSANLHIIKCGDESSDAFHALSILGLLDAVNEVNRLE